jgi:hypothetical protein
MTRSVLRNVLKRRRARLIRNISFQPGDAGVLGSEAGPKGAGLQFDDRQAVVDIDQFLQFIAKLRRRLRGRYDPQRFQQPYGAQSFELGVDVRGMSRIMNVVADCEVVHRISNSHKDNPLVPASSKAIVPFDTSLRSRLDFRTEVKVLRRLLSNFATAQWKIRRIGAFRAVLAASGAHIFPPPGRARHPPMRGLFSQIIIGVIVTVLGTVIANAIVGGGRGGHHFLPGHFSGSNRH